MAKKALKLGWWPYVPGAEGFNSDMFQSAWADAKAKAPTCGFIGWRANGTAIDFHFGVWGEASFIITKEIK